MRQRYLLLSTTVLCGALCAAPALANPQGGVVTSGSAAISSSGNTLTIQQTSDRAIINWSGFDISQGETTQFQQPNSGSIVLNRISENSPSQINGNLTANGNVILINPNGVVFGPTSTVNVNSLVATTSDTDNNAFMAGGKITFNKPGSGTASIVNQGQITAAQAGLIGLVAPQVINSGVITAKLGQVTLASGDTFTLDLAGDGLTSIAVSGAMQQQLVENSGTINAQGGTIQITAAAARNAVDALITNSGTLEADSFQQQGGTIILSAGNGTVTNSGNIYARGLNSGESGGTVTVAAKNVQQNGTIDVSGQQNGGSVNINFAQSYNDTPSSSIAANGVTGNGGNINVTATQASSTITASGTYQATSQQAQGGSISMAAGTVNVTSATLDASGASGGTITIGFDPTTGLDTEGIVISSATTLRADGTQAAGGTIDLLGQTITMQGLASATGLTQGGTINVNFNTSYTDSADAMLTAASAQGSGGEVYVTGADEATLTASGSYIADGGTTGGEIAMLTQQGNILLLGAYLSSRGNEGSGGTIRIGIDPLSGNESEDTELEGANIITDSEVSDGGEIDIFGRSSLALRNTRTSSRGGRNGGRTRVGSNPFSGTRTRNTLIGGSATLDANGTTGSGGSIDVEGSTITVSGVLIADGNIGGDISVLADQSVTLTGATINADGAEGGGYIKIGGDFQGQGNTLTAQNTSLDASTVISANATNNGDGGKVAVWSDDQTDFYGTISAEGGPNGGNGGYVETSGHVLDAQGIVYAKTWLLDPADLTIDDGSGSEINISSSGTNPITYQTGSGSTTNSYLNAATIVSELNAGTNIMVKTSNTGTGGNGDIIVSSAITSTGAGNLTISAYRDIVVNAAISLAGGSLILDADNANNHSGYIHVKANITTNGGNLVIGGGSGTITAGSGYAWDSGDGSSYGDGVEIGGFVTVNTGAGNIIINGHGNNGSSVAYDGVDISNSTIETTSGNISINGIGGNGGDDSIGISNGFTDSSRKKDTFFSERAYNKA